MTKTTDGTGPLGPDPADRNITDVMYGGRAPSDPAGPDGVPAFDGAPDSVTETTSVSWFDKLLESIVGVGLGVVLVLAMAALLFWNEGRAVKTYRSLDEGAGLVVDVPTDKIAPGRENRLVHVQGDLTAASPAVDPALGMEARAAHLVRTVEMYQWREESHTETHKRVGGGEDRVTTYTYSRVWSDQRNASERFRNQAGHQNPQLRFGRAEFAAPDAKLGAFRPGEAALNRLHADRTEQVDDATLTRARIRPGIGLVSVSDGMLYLGPDPGNPRVGDIRVTYRTALLGPSTFIGRQSGTSLVEYQTRAGDQLLMARSGLVPAADMFAEARSDNRVLTWIIRAVASLVMWIGFLLILRPIAVLGDVVPIIGTMLGVGTAFAAFAATLVVAPLVIATAWLFFRPLLAASLAVVVAACFYGLKALAIRRRAQAGGPALTPRPA